MSCPLCGDEIKGATVSLTTPIVEGAYYERQDKEVVGPATPSEPIGAPGCYNLSGYDYDGSGFHPIEEYRLTRRVWLVPTDPAEVIAELRQKETAAAERKESNKGHDIWVAEDYAQQAAFHNAANLVAQKLGVGK